MRQQGQGAVPRRRGSRALRRLGFERTVTMRVTLIDNYDSFTYNLYHYLGELGAEIRVFRNDEIDLHQIAAMKPAKIVISPGPCTPKEAGISCEVVTRFGEKTPILGVCLGHQCIGAAFGGEIIRAPT